ncbi:unnamed protein product [Linum tenue]|uniref:Uncharacterized protein n=1 Tax=Linum tenue TaxID=586396 RepID=A0AAV0JCF3_9ROSI|nr:unnamed protein product [Linum tenue]
MQTLNPYMSQNISQFGKRKTAKKRGMAATTSSIFAATVLILFAVTSAAANWDEEAPTSELIHVSGKVLCQDCQKSYKDWISGERPIKGSTVSLTCMDDRKRVHHYDSDVTDERGEYEMVEGSPASGSASPRRRTVAPPSTTSDRSTTRTQGASDRRLASLMTNPVMIRSTIVTLKPNTDIFSVLNVYYFAI